MAPATEGLRYGRESIEDDPFIVAASTQSLNSIDRKKEKQAPCVNYGYLSEGRLIITVRLYSVWCPVSIDCLRTEVFMSVAKLKKANDEDLQI